MDIKTKPISAKAQAPVQAETTTAQRQVKLTPELSQYTVGDLPSGRVPYPSLTISIRPYTWAEQKALSSFSSLKDTLRVVKEGCESNIPIEALTVGDFLMVALLRKLYSFPRSEASCTITCPSCGEKIKEVISLSDLDFKEMRAKVCPVVIKNNGTGEELSLYPVTILDLVDELEVADKTTLEDRLISRMFKDVNKIEALNIVKQADTVLGGVIKKVIEAFDCSILPIEFNCKACGKSHKESLGVDGRDVILEPFLTEEDNSQYTVSFGD